MVTLVSLMTRVDSPPVLRVQRDSVLWWYVARASGLLAWMLLGVSVMGGLLMSTQLTRGSSRRWTQGFHEFVGALAVVFTVIHLASVLATTRLRIGLRQLFVPFARPDNPWAQGCGVLAFYLLTAVMLTSWARAWLPRRWWRRVHLLTFPLWVLASGHTVLAGSDTSSPVLHWASLVVGVAILFLGALRLLTGRPTAGTAGLGVGASAEPALAPTTAGLPATTPAVVPATAGTGMRLLIGQTTWEADDVLSLRLNSPDGAPLPRWEGCAHRIGFALGTAPALLTVR
jgi:DMSO/TMAO reductase YedYZ heme-binding membrane subunit